MLFANKLSQHIGERKNHSFEWFPSLLSSVGVDGLPAPAAWLSVDGRALQALKGFKIKYID